MGLPTVFVRLTGCPLRCHYCDTTYAFSGGTLMDIDAILFEVAKYSPRYVTDSRGHVTVTGGEPLAQLGCITLLARLCDLGYRVSLETSGAIDVSDVDPRVVKVMDFKTPGSGESHRNLYANVEWLCAHDQVKFVICNRGDYEWARMKLDQYDLCSKVADVLFSSSFEELEARKLAEWVLQDRLPVRVQIQLHKLLWGDVPGR